MITSSSAKLKLLSRFGHIYVLMKKKRVPKVIVVEPTNMCNLRCPVCPTHFAMKRERGMMKLRLFRQIIDEFGPLPKKPEIQFRMSGEPLLHPEIAELVRYAGTKGHSTMISSNGTLLSEHLSRDLIEANLNEMVLALDGFSKESYEAYRRGARFEKVVENIERFAAVRKKLRKARPKLVIQTLLTSGSEGETDSIKEWAQSIGADQVNFKSLSMGIYTTPEMKDHYGYLMPRQGSLQRVETHKTRYCLAPLKHVMIYWNGDLGLCCKDFDNNAGLPSLVDNGFLKTFHSNEVQQKRDRGVHREHELCKRCDMDRFSFKGFSVKLT